MKTIKRLGSMMLAVLLLFTTVFVLFPERTHALFDQTKASQYYITVMIADPDNATCCTNSEGYIVITTKKQNGQDGPVWWAKVNAEDWDVENGVAYYTYGCNGKQTRDQAAKNVKPIEGFPTEIKFLKSKDPKSTDYIQCNNWFHNTIVNIGVYVSCNPGYVNDDRHAVYTGHEEVRIHGYFTKKKTIDYANKKPRPVSCTFIEGPSEIRIPKSGTASYQYSVNVYDQYYVKWYNNTDGTNWQVNSGISSNYLSIDRNGKLTISANAAYNDKIGEDFEIIVYSGLMWETQTSMPNCRMYITVKPPLFDYVYRDVNGNVDSTRRGGTVLIGYNMNNFRHSVTDPELPNENPDHYRFVRWEKYPSEKTVYQDFYFKPVFETTHVWDLTRIVSKTCTREETRYYKCRYCSATKTETSPARGHVWNRGEYADGVVTTICTYCGAREDYTVPEDSRLPEQGLTAVYGSTLNDVALPARWRWGTSGDAVGNVGTNYHIALYNYKDSDNITIRMPVDVTPATIESSLSLNDWTYGNKANTPMVAGNTVNAPVRFLFKPRGTADTEYTGTVPAGAGKYSVKAVFEQTGNYDVAPSTADFEILPRSVVVKADDSSKVYRTADPSFTASVKGLAEGDTPDLIRYGLARSEGEAEGNYTITPSGDRIQGNYSVTYETGTFKIVPTTKYAADIENGSGDGNYEEGVTVSIAADPASQGMVFDRWVSEDVILADASSPVTNFKMPEKAVKVKASYVKEKTDPIVTKDAVAGEDLVYDGTGQALVQAGKVEGGTMLYALGTETEVTGRYSEKIPTGTDAGTYYVWRMVRGDSAHRDISAKCIVSTVSKRDITVSGISAMDKPYDGDDKAVLNLKGVILEGRVGSDELTVAASGAFADPEPGKDKPVTISGLVLGGDAAKNYKLAEKGQQTSAEATITPNELSVVVNGYDGVYDGKNHSILAYSEQSGVKITYSESKEGTFSETNPEYSAPGHYVVYYMAEKEGCESVYGAGTVNIDRKDMSPADSYRTIVVDEIAYDGSPKKPEITEKDGNTELKPGTDYEITYEGVWPTVYRRTETPPAKGGEYRVIISYIGNYIGEKELSFSIMGDPGQDKEQEEPEEEEQKPDPDKPSEEEQKPGTDKPSGEEQKPDPDKPSEEEQKPGPVKPDEEEQKPDPDRPSEEEQKPGPVKPEEEKDGPGPEEPDVKVYRLFDPKTGAHFYTADEAEYDSLIAGYFVDEGIGWRMPVKSTVPIYRLFDAGRTGEHVFTGSKAEKEELEAGGWTYEGIAFYEGESKKRPVHRLINERNGMSHYTADEDEIKALIAAGWIDERIAFGVR